PVGDGVIELGDFGVRSQERKDEPFEERAALFCADGSEVAPRGAHDARVDPVQLRMATLAYPQPGLEGWQSRGEQRVLKDADVPLDGRPRRARISSEAADVDHLPVEQRGDRKETQEPRQGGDEGLATYLLSDVGVDVRVEGRSRVVGAPHERDAPETENATQVEVGPELRRHERIHRPDRRAA